MWSQRLLFQRQMGKLSEADSFFQSHFLFIHSSPAYPFLPRLGDCQLPTDSKVKHKDALPFGSSQFSERVSDVTIYNHNKREWIEKQDTECHQVLGRGRGQE